MKNVLFALALSAVILPITLASRVKTPKKKPVAEISLNTCDIYSVEQEARKNTLERCF